MCASGRVKRRPEAAVEPGREVAGQLEVLPLVLTDRHLVGLVDEDVGGLQHRVGEQADGRAGGALPLALVLELRHPAGLAEAGQALQHPGQLQVLGHVALHEQRAARRVDAEGEQLRGGDQGAAAQHLRVLRQRDRVQVDDAVERLVPCPAARPTGAAHPGSCRGGRSPPSAGCRRAHGEEARRPSNQPTRAGRSGLPRSGHRGAVRRRSPRRATSSSAARKTSSSSGVPTVTRMPSPANGRVMTARASSAAASAAACSPTGSQTKLAWLSATSSPRSRRAAVSRSRSATTAAQRAADLVLAGQRRDGGRLGEHRDAERHVRLAHRLGHRRVLGDQVADPQPGQPPRLGERPQDGDVRPAAHELHAVGDVGVGDELAVGLVEDDERLRGDGVEEALELGRAGPPSRWGCSGCRRTPGAWCRRSRRPAPSRSWVSAGPPGRPGHERHLDRRGRRRPGPAAGTSRTSARRRRCSCPGRCRPGPAPGTASPRRSRWPPARGRRRSGRPAPG